MHYCFTSKQTNRWGWGGEDNTKRQNILNNRRRRKKEEREFGGRDALGPPRYSTTPWTLLTALRAPWPLDSGFWKEQLPHSVLLGHGSQQPRKRYTSALLDLESLSSGPKPKWSNQGLSMRPKLILPTKLLGLNPTWLTG